MITKVENIMEENEGLPDIHKMKDEVIRDEILQDNFFEESEFRTNH